MDPTSRPRVAPWMFAVVVAWGGACGPAAPGVQAPTPEPAPTVSRSESTGDRPATAAGDAAPQTANKPQTARNWGDQVCAASDWLVRHQSADGRWDLSVRAQRCTDARCAAGEEGSDPVGETALALMALLATGTNLGDKSYGPALRAGFAYLLSVQGADGSFGSRPDPHHILDQALAIDALFWLVSSSANPEVPYRPALERAVPHLVSLRRPGAAWGEDASGTACDLGVTTWATLAVANARAWEPPIAVPDDVFRDVLAWLDTDPGSATEADAAIRTCARVYAGTTQRDPHLLADHEILRRTDPVGADGAVTGAPLDAEGRYFVTRAGWLWGGPIWRHRRQFNADVFPPLQRPAEDGCVGGSWDAPVAARRGDGPTHGRLGATALTLMLEDPCFVSTYRNAMEDTSLIPK